MQSTVDISGWDDLGVKEVVIKVGFGVVGSSLPLAYGNYPECR